MAEIYLLTRKQDGAVTKTAYKNFSKALSVMSGIVDKSRTEGYDDNVNTTITDVKYTKNVKLMKVGCNAIRLSLENIQLAD